jgi:hypothetical protein
MNDKTRFHSGAYPYFKKIIKEIKKSRKADHILWLYLFLMDLSIFQNFIFIMILKLIKSCKNYIRKMKYVYKRRLIITIIYREKIHRA